MLNNLIKVFLPIVAVIFFGTTSNCHAQIQLLNNTIEVKEILIYEDTGNNKLMPDFDKAKYDLFDPSQEIVLKPTVNNSVFWIVYILRVKKSDTLLMQLNISGLNEKNSSQSYKMFLTADDGFDRYMSERTNEISAKAREIPIEYYKNEGYYSCFIRDSGLNTIFCRLQVTGTNISVKTHLNVYFKNKIYSFQSKVLISSCLSWVFFILFFFIALILFYIDRSFLFLPFIVFCFLSALNVFSLLKYSNYDILLQEETYMYIGLYPIYTLCSSVLLFIFQLYCLGDASKGSFVLKFFLGIFSFVLVFNVTSAFAVNNIPFVKILYRCRSVVDIFVLLSLFLYATICFKAVINKPKLYLLFNGLGLILSSVVFFCDGYFGRQLMAPAPLIVYAGLHPLLLGGIYFVFSIHLFFTRKEERKKTEETMRTRDDNKMLQQIIRIEEEERKRMSQDLHDDLGGTLSRLKMYMTQSRDLDQFTADAFQKYKEESIFILNTALSDLRHISHNLMPQNILMIGLQKSLLEFIEVINRNKQITMRLIYSVDDTLLNKDLQLAVYRIISELIQNILKHSRASLATISILGFDTYFQLLVEDDGIGFSEARRNRGGIGLKNIESRVGILKGTITIDSGVSGTTVIIEIPFNNL